MALVSPRARSDGAGIDPRRIGPLAIREGPGMAAYNLFGGIVAPFQSRRAKIAYRRAHRTGSPVFSAEKARNRFDRSGWTGEIEVSPTAEIHSLSRGTVDARLADVRP